MSMIDTTSEYLKSRNIFTCVTDETKDSDIECVLGYSFSIKVLLAIEISCSAELSMK